jgi:hypothetical protein
MTSDKATASRIQLKSNSIPAAYFVVEKTAVMDCGFSRMSRRETGRCCRRHVGRPAAICHRVDFAIDLPLGFHAKSVSNRASKGKPNVRPRTTFLILNLVLPRWGFGSSFD